jgi:hypothetical protein
MPGSSLFASLGRGRAERPGRLPTRLGPIHADSVSVSAASGATAPRAYIPVIDCQNTTKRNNNDPAAKVKQIPRFFRPYFSRSRADPRYAGQRAGSVSDRSKPASHGINGKNAVDSSPMRAGARTFVDGHLRPGGPARV